VSKILVEGSATRIGSSKVAADMQLAAAIKAALSCDGPTSIYTAGINEVASLKTLADILGVQEVHPIDIWKHGLRSVDPNQVVMNGPM
jgi:hypothetical protein